MTAPELNARYLLAKAEYDEACRVLLVARDRQPVDDLAAKVQLRVLDLLEQVCQTYEWQIEELESRAAGAVADAQLARLVDSAHTFGGRPYDVPRCEHGCCPDAVCLFVGDCASHQAAS